jgi:RHS repeat-associated protein
VVVPGGTASGTFTYDLNGNLTSDGTRSFEWDAENRLVAVVIGTHRSEFVYDELGRRVEILEKDSNVMSSDKKYLWDGEAITEERDSTGALATRKFYAQGFVDTDATNLYYTRDHLGSVRELVDMSGAVRARYDFDPYGRVTKISGDRDSVFGYTGHMWHTASGLNLTFFRAYAPETGRWISRDPYKEKGGLNLYRYVRNNPINMIDPLGLDGVYVWPPSGGNVGHAAAEIGGVYYSFWPQGAFPRDGISLPGTWNNYASDVASEDGKAPIYIPLDGPNYPDASKLPTPSEPAPGTWSPWSDCADEANKRLRKKYPNLPKHWKWNGVYWPEDLLNDVNRMLHPIPTIPWDQDPRHNPFGSNSIDWR